jgi:hypothetical protein
MFRMKKQKEIMPFHFNHSRHCPINKWDIDLMIKGQVDLTRMQVENKLYMDIQFPLV